MPDLEKQGRFHSVKLSDADQIRQKRILSALQDLELGKSKAYIQRKWGLSRTQLQRARDRWQALTRHGGIFGPMSLVAGSRVTPYTRVKPLEHNDDGVGLAGAFGKVLNDHPDVHDWLDKRLAPARGKGYREAGMRLVTVHSEFLTRLRADGAPATEYPFTCNGAGYDALCSYVRKKVNEDDAVAEQRYGEDARSGLMARSGVAGITRALFSYERVAYDEYELPDIATLVLEIDDSEIDVPLSRAYLCPIVDFKSDCVLGFDVAIDRRFSSINLLTAFENSIKPSSLKRRGMFTDYPIKPGEGLPTAVVPESRGRRICSLEIDNHLAHFSNDVVEHLRTRSGAIISFGPVRKWIVRAVVENLFSELQVELTRLASTTGSGPADPVVKDPVKMAQRFRMRLTDLLHLLDVLISRHNAKRQRRLKLRTANEVIAAESAPSHRLSIVPRFDDEFVEDPGIAVEIAYRTVRGNRAKGRPPYVQLEEAEYTNDILRQSWHMVGKVRLELHLRGDMRSVRAFLPDGSEFGVLEVCDHWKSSAHSRELRKEINRQYRQGILSERGVDPVTHYQDSLARQAALDAAKGKLSSAGGGIARSLADNPTSDDDVFRYRATDTTPQKKPSATSQGRRAFFEDEPDDD